MGTQQYEPPARLVLRTRTWGSSAERGELAVFFSSEFPQRCWVFRKPVVWVGHLACQPVSYRPPQSAGNFRTCLQPAPLPQDEIAILGEAKVGCLSCWQALSVTSEGCSAGRFQSKCSAWKDGAVLSKGSRTLTFQVLGVVMFWGVGVFGSPALRLAVRKGLWGQRAQGSPLLEVVLDLHVPSLKGGSKFDVGRLMGDSLLQPNGFPMF